MTKHEWHIVQAGSPFDDGVSDKVPGHMRCSAHCSHPRKEKDAVSYRQAPAQGRGCWWNGERSKAEGNASSRQEGAGRRCDPCWKKALFFLACSVCQ